MNREYIKPFTDIVYIEVDAQLMAGSVPDYDGPFNSREYEELEEEYI
jgi:hypothetical protein